MQVDAGDRLANENAKWKEELAQAESMLKALPKEPSTEFGKEQKFHLERHRDACKSKLRAAQPFEWRAHDVVNQKKQLEDKRIRLEG
eukprot:5320285-Pyramimonas_sp.AAC.1